MRFFKPYLLILAILKSILHDFSLHIFSKLQAQNHTLHKNHNAKIILAQNQKALKYLLYNQLLILPKS